MQIALERLVVSKDVVPMKQFVGFGAMWMKTRYTGIEFAGLTLPGSRG